MKEPTQIQIDAIASHVEEGVSIEDAAAKVKINPVLAIMWQHKGELDAVNNVDSQCAEFVLELGRAEAKALKVAEEEALEVAEEKYAIRYLDILYKRQEIASKRRMNLAMRKIELEANPNNANQNLNYEDSFV